LSALVLQGVWDEVPRSQVPAGRRVVPSHFVFALFVLYQQHAPAGEPHADPLWQAWVRHLEATRAGADSIVFWSDDELADLDEPRLVEGASRYRNALRDQHAQLLAPLQASVTRQRDTTTRLSQLGEHEWLAVAAGPSEALKGHRSSSRASSRRRLMSPSSAALRCWPR